MSKNIVNKLVLYNDLFYFMNGVGDHDRWSFHSKKCFRLHGTRTKNGQVFENHVNINNPQKNINLELL